MTQIRTRLDVVELNSFLKQKILEALGDDVKTRSDLKRMLLENEGTREVCEDSDVA